MTHTSIRSSLAALGFAALLALTGCVNVYTGQENKAEAPQSPAAQAAPTQAPVSEEPQEQQQAPTTPAAPAQPAKPAPVTANPADANFGVNCGTSSTGQSTIVIAEANPAITCDEAHGAMNGFNEQFFATGSLGPFTSGAYTCQSRNDSERFYEGRSVTCTRSGVRIEAMYYYPHGGSPVLTNGSYSECCVGTLRFKANGLECVIGSRFFLCQDLDELDAYGDTERVTYTEGSSGPEYQRIDGHSNLPKRELLTGQVITVGYPPEGNYIACLNDGMGVSCADGTITAHMSTSTLGRP